jgi:cysteine-rich repeat protein
MHQMTSFTTSSIARRLVVAAGLCALFPGCADEGDEMDSLPPVGGGPHDGSETFECGDGEQNSPYEDCDDGNTNDGDACPSDCLLPDRATLLWSQSLAPFEYSNAEDLVIGEDGTMLIGIRGFTDSDGQLGAVAMAPDGRIAWTALHNGPGMEYIGGSYDDLRSVARTSDGISGLCGCEMDESDDEGYFMRALGPDGQELWTDRDAGGARSCCSHLVAQGSDFVTVRRDEFASGSSDLFLVRYAGAQSVPSWAQPLMLDGASQLFILDSQILVPGTFDDTWTLVSYSLDGELLWSYDEEELGVELGAFYPSAHADALAVLRFDSISFVVDELSITEQGSFTSLGSKMLSIPEYRASLHRYGFSHVTVGPDDAVFMTFDSYLWKFDREGNALWETQLEELNEIDEELKGLWMTPQGELVVMVNRDTRDENAVVVRKYALE